MPTNQNILAATIKYQQEPYTQDQEYFKQLKEVAPLLSMVTTVNDIRDAVGILKKRADGLSLVEAMDAFRKRILNPQKIAVYEYWGIINRQSNRLSLSPLGWELARRIEPEISLFRAIIDSIPLYRSALDWIDKQSFDRISHPQVIAHWVESFSSTVHDGCENAIKMNAISFFHLCQAAEFGTVTLGKRGQPARLQVDRVELAEHIRFAPTALDTSSAGGGDALKLLTHDRLGSQASSPSTGGGLLRFERPCCLISCSLNSPIVEQVRATLGFVECESEVVERGEIAENFSIEQMQLSLRTSVAAIIILTADDCRRDDQGNSLIKEPAAMMIGASCAICENRVLLIREKDLRLPANLDTLKQCEFQGENFSLESGLLLMRAIKEWNIDNI